MEDYELLNQIGERLVDEHLSIKEENFRLRQIINNDFVISFIIDKNGFFILPNRKSLKVMGIQAKKLKTKNALTFFEKNPRAVANIRRALKGESLSDVLKLDRRYWKVNYQPIYDEEGKLIGISGLSIDVTDIICNPETYDTD
ncbi:MAG: PAS domain S-box protein [Thermonemataceae bacterium]